MTREEEKVFNTLSGIKKKIWTCKIGEAEEYLLPDGASQPMREAVRKAYYDLVGKDPDFIFCGWGGELDEVEEEILTHPKVEPFIPND